MTPEEKNKIVFGQRYIASTIVEEEVKTGDGKTEMVIKDSEETLNLRPIMVRDFNELDSANPIDFDALLIAFTARKTIDWVKNSLNSADLTNLSKICEEINVGFFDWRARTAENIEALGQRNRKLLEKMADLHLPSQILSPKPQTDTV
jgi:hypothetical protein